MFLQSKQAQYTYRILLLIWLIISIHVGYRYITFSSVAEQGKGGTFVEATTEKGNYLPYVTNNDADKFYQSFLFNGCTYPSFSGTNISYREELCTVTTTDYKSFVVQANDNKYRSDGESVTLNDIYFSYNTVLKENYRNIGALDGYSNISIIADEENESMQVLFPKASIDNVTFFTNFILPSHLLANQTLEHYVTTFFTNPVGTNCGQLSATNNDKDSIVFDLSNCSDVPLKFYQVKQFEDQTELETYVASAGNTIDLIVDERAYTGYDTNKVILNTFSTLFFNTQSPTLSTSARKKLGSEIVAYLDTTNILDPYIVKDHFLFDSFLSNDESTNLANILKEGTKNEDTQDNSLAILPQIIRRQAAGTQNQEYILEKPIEDKQPIKFTFDTAYDKISVSYNNGIEYFPESYSAAGKSSYYNLNPTYRNIAKGRNTYTVKTYKGGTHTETFNLVVHYLSEPTYPQEEIVVSDKEDYQPLSIIYLNDTTSTAIADALKTMFTTANISDYFVFSRFDDPDIFAGKIESTDYDIAIKSISMGLRRDISNIFLTDNPTINPSLYINKELALAVNEWFLFSDAAKPGVKQRIDAIYSKDMPFILLGKQFGSIHIEDSLLFPYPLRMYVLGWRKDFIKDLPIFQHFRIDRDRVWKRNNFNSFLRAGGVNDADSKS